MERADPVFVQPRSYTILFKKNHQNKMSFQSEYLFKWGPPNWGILKLTFH